MRLSSRYASAVCLFGMLFAAILGPNLTHASTINVPTNFLSINKGLVGWWTFDGKDVSWATGQVADVSGNGGTGLVTGMATSTAPVAGKIGQALSFDGANSYLTLGSASTLSFTGPFTLSFWMNPTDGTGADHTIINKGLAFGSVNTWQYYIHQNPFGDNGRIYFGVSDGTNQCLIESAASFYSPNVWTFATVLFDGTFCYIYRNGVLNATSNSSPLGTLNPIAAGPVVGVRSGASTWFYKGAIDDIRGYNRVLSANEITQLYNLGSAKANTSKTNIRQNGLVGWWTFDGNNLLQNAADSSGNGNNGNLKSFTSTSTAVVKGKIGQALSFDGVASTVSVPASGSTDLTGEMTASAWIYPNSLSGEMEVVGERTGNTTMNYQLLINNPSGTVGAQWGGNTSPAIATTTSAVLVAKKWQHILFTRTGSTGNWTASIYYNGVLSGQKLITLNPNGSTGTCIGALSCVGISDFNGYIDDVRIYNRALSASEILQLYNSGTNLTNTTPVSPLTRGLLAWWTFDGKTMFNNIADMSGNGNNANLQGGTTTVPGKFGQGLSFDGTSGSYAQFPGITLGSVFTMSAWVNYRSCPGSVWCPVIATTNTANAGWLIVGAQTFYSGSDHSSNTVVTTNKWHHVAIVGTGSDVLFYLDGAPDGSAGIAAPTATWDLFGADTISGDNDYVNGSVDDIRIYNRSLSAAEIRLLYQGGK